MIEFLGVLVVLFVARHISWVFIRGDRQLKAISVSGKNFS